jgi:hypothetical protein
MTILLGYYFSIPHTATGYSGLHADGLRNASGRRAERFLSEN